MIVDLISVQIASETGFFLSTSRTLDLQFLDYHVLEFLIYRDSICEIIVFSFIVIAIFAHGIFFVGVCI